MEMYYSPNDPRFRANDDAAMIQNAVDAAAADGIQTAIVKEGFTLDIRN